MSWDPESNTYVTGSGQVLHNVHALQARCVNEGCIIHNPTTHPVDDLPTHWRGDRGIMERTCKHGVGHPDPDDQAYLKTIGREDGVHGCDGCCSRRARQRRDKG